MEHATNLGTSNLSPQCNYSFQGQPSYSDKFTLSHHHITDIPLPIETEHRPARISTIVQDDHIDDKKTMVTKELRSFERFDEFLNNKNIDEIFKHENVFPETRTSLSRCTSKIPTRKRNPTNYITIINNHYYVDSDSSSMEDLDEDVVNYKNEYFDYGEIIKPELDIETPMGLIYSFRKKGNAVVNYDPSFCRSSSTDSSRSFVQHPDQDCQIVELNSPVERLPTPIPGLYHFEPNAVCEGVLPIVTEVSDTISTDDNAARTIILENTWFIGYENDSFKDTSYAKQPQFEVEEVDFQNNVSLQVKTKTQEYVYDMKNRARENSTLSPQICDTDVGIQKLSFRDKLIARAKAKREMFETPLNSSDQSKDNIKSQDTAQNQNFDRLIGKQAEITKDVNETDFTYNNVKEHNIQMSMRTQKIRHNSAPNKIFRIDDIPSGINKPNYETQSTYQQNSSQAKDTTIKVDNHRQGTNDNFQTPMSKRTYFEQEKNNKSNLVQEKCVQTNFRICCNEFKQAKASAQLKRQNEAFRIKEKRDLYSIDKQTQYESQPQEFSSNIKARTNAKSLFCSYYKPETYAEGFPAYDIALNGKSREVNEQINDDMALDETGYDKMLYKNYSFRKSDESMGFLSRGSVTSRGTMKVFSARRPWWEVFFNCFKCCKFNLKFNK